MSDQRRTVSSQRAAAATASGSLAPKSCPAPAMRTRSIRGLFAAMRSRTANGPSSSFSPWTTRVGHLVAASAASSRGRGRLGGAIGWPRMTSASGDSRSARKAEMRPPNERPTRAMRSYPSVRRWSRAARRSSISDAYSLLGREPRVVKVTARDAMPNPSSDATRLRRIGCSAVPPYPGARTAARFKPAASAAFAQARAMGPEGRQPPPGAATCS